MIRLYSILLSAIFIPLASAGQQVTRLSLNDCIDYALKHNYTIKNAAIDVLIQQAQNNETVAAAYPHINAKLELDDYLNPQQSLIDGKYLGMPGTTEKFAFTLPYGGSGSINATQVVFDGAVLIALKARKTVMEFARQNSAVTEEGIRYNIFKAYNSLVIAYRQYDIVKNSLSYARGLEHDITVTQQNGFAEKIDVERTSVQVNNLATDSIRIGNLLTVSEEVLKYQIGMDIKTPIVLTDTLVDQRKQDAVDLLLQEKKYDRIPEYILSQTSLTLNEFNLKRYQLEAWPTVNAFGGMGYNYPSTNFNQIFVFPNYLFNSAIGLQVNIPIFNGLLRKNQVTEAKLNVEKSKNTIENVKQTIDFQEAQARTSLKNAILETQSQHRNLELATDVLDLARRKYKAGVGSNLEVTQAQTDQLSAQTNYFNALLDIINAEADLKKALGLLK
jgi:outer membrane protein TolC